MPWIIISSNNITLLLVIKFKSITFRVYYCKFSYNSLVSNDGIVSFER